MTKRNVIIGHVDHGKTSLTAALVRVLAAGVRVKENCRHCGGGGDVGPAKSAEGDWLDQPCPRCGGSGEEPRASGESTTAKSEEPNG